MEYLPAVDPIPLPAPVWLFKVLHSATLALHFVAVYFLIGGLVCAAVWAIHGRRNKNYVALNASGAVTTRLPVVMAYVINLGVPPLLFAQALYGQALYTSSVLIGAYWISVVFLLMIAYGLLYHMSQRAENGRAFGWLGLIATVVLLKIGFIYSTNMTLMLRPDMWTESYRVDPLGTSLAFQDPTTMPRWLFMMLGSVGVCGVGLMLLGFHKNLGQDTGAFLQRWGGRLLAFFTVVQFALAYSIVSRQPEAVRVALADSNFYNVVAWLWMGTAVCLIPLGLFASTQAAVRAMRWPLVCATTALVNLIAMVLYRDAIRDAALAQYGFDVWALEVTTNWSVVGVFLVLFVAAGVFIGWMTAVVFRAKEGSERYA